MKSNPVQNMTRDFVISHVPKSQTALVGSILRLSRIGLNHSLAAASSVVASFTILQCAPAQAVNLVTNGNFETGDFTGWTNDGSQKVGSAPLGGNNSQVATFPKIGSLGFISQIVSTIAGQNYLLSFDLANYEGTPNEFRVRVNSNILFDQVNIPTQTAYTPYIFNFVGTGSDTIEFGGRNDPSGLLLDNVVVDGAAYTSVPEPFTIIGTLVGGTAAVRMRKKLKSVNKG